MTEHLSRRVMAQPQQGFTLLEVMVALTITAMVLGSLFALATGSKQLAFRSRQSLTTAVEARAAINFAFLQNEYGEVEAALDNERFTIRGEEFVEKVERKTEANTLTLQYFEVLDEDTDERIEGTRWVKLELPE